MPSDPDFPATPIGEFADDSRGEAGDADGLSEGYRSGDGLFAFGEDCLVREWNHEAEQLTGIPADDALGRPCWEVFAGADDNGGIICHPGCSRRRLLGDGWPVRSQEMLIATTDGRRRVTVSSVALRSVDPPIFLHIFRNGDPDPPARPEAGPRLTPRQLEILELLHAGRPVKTIAVELGIAEVTVRNHIQAVLLELRAHSQLEALATARRLGLLSSA